MMLQDGLNPIFCRSYPAEMSAWPLIRSEVLCVASDAGWSENDLGQLELVLEEGALNIINHAYVEKSGEIEISLFPVEGGLLLSLSDSGVPFDPVAAPAPDINAPTAERSIGGLGIHLIKTLAERIEYNREGERNVLEIVLKQHGV